MRKIQSKIKALEWSQDYFHEFFKCSRAANSVVSDGILTKFKLIQVFIVVLVTCKNEEDSSKIEGTTVVTTFLPLIGYWDFFKCSGAANSSVTGLILSNFESIRDFVVFLVTCKNKEVQIKNEEARMATRFSPL